MPKPTKPQTELVAVVIESCQWFARCTNIATCTIEHPVLGKVPACDRCATLAGVR